MFIPEYQHNTTGKTPKLTRSQRESIWIPNLFSSIVLSFLLLATFPSNASNRPESARHNIPMLRCPVNVKNMPVIDDTRLIYVKITV